MWTIHFLSVALIAEWGCLSGWYEWQMLGVTGVAWAIILVTLLLSILAMTVTYFSFVVLQESKRASVENSVHDLYDQPGNRHLLAYTGLITSLVFLLTILVQSVPILFYLSEC